MSRNWSPRGGLTLTLVLLFVGLCIWNSLLYRNNLQEDTWNYAFNVGVAIFYIFGFVIAIWHSRKPQMPKLTRRIFVYFGLASLSWGIAYLVWSYYNLVLEVDIPYPSFADLFFLISYPLLGAALWSLHEAYGTRASKKVIRDSVIIVLVSMVVIFAFLNRPDLSPDLGLSKNLLNIAYSLADVLLVAAALIELREGHARKHKGLYLLIGFLILQACGDFMFAYRNNEGVYWNGDVADLLFGASAFVLAVALTQNNLVVQSKPK